MFVLAETYITATASSSQTPKPAVVAGADHVYSAELPNGTNYEVHYRTLRGQWEGRDVHVVVNAYYKPGSGEFLYYSSIWDYLRDFNEKVAWVSKPGEGHVALLEDGEWADFRALTSGPRLVVYHSNFRFYSIEEAWRYVLQHFAECQLPSGQAKCCDEIPLYKDLDFDFFRPERLRWSAAPYSYNPLVSAKKVGSAWEVVIRGADEPNRALVILDKNFKLVKITRLSALK
jgi:hypothetical protein